MKPSQVIEQSIDALTDAFPTSIDVEGRIVSRHVAPWKNGAGRLYEFVNLKLVDVDASGSTVALAVSTTVDDLDRILGRSGLDPQAVTAEGEKVVVTGLLRGQRNSGMPQLQLSSIAPTGISADMVAVQKLAVRINEEGLGDLRHEVLQDTRIVRRVAVIGTPTGFQDVRDGFKGAKHLAAPAMCCHEINPQSPTAVIDVPRLIADHLDEGVDAILIAFGGHLTIPSPWDSEEVVDAIVDAHRRGVAVLAGFAHAKDKPLVKRVAFDLNQASAAAARLVQRNDDRVAPLMNLGRAAQALLARHGKQEDDLGRTAARTVREVGRSLDRREVALAASVRTLADRTARRRLETASHLSNLLVSHPRRLQARVEAAEGELRAASVVSRMLDNGWAMVADEAGQPIDAPATDQIIRIRTATHTFRAIITNIEEEP